MRVRAIGLQNFRNIAATRLEFEGRLQFLGGPNGQGKTNLLEAIGFITALRSFRAADNAHLINHGQKEAALSCDLEHELEGPSKLTVKFRPGTKEAWLDETKVARLADVIGRFPSVVFSSQDQQLVRGSPGGRRRWLDLTLSATDRAYLNHLQSYHRALAERNTLLKRNPAEAELDAFEQVMADHGAALVAKRRDALLDLGNVLSASYARIADHAEPTGFSYDPNFDATDAVELMDKLVSGRARDRIMKSTGSGPHRDDFDFTLHDRAAKDFASEGQQRALVLSLRLAQADWFRRCMNIEPVLLADDVLGELDPVRRERFWRAIAPESQVIATGTVYPEGDVGDWQKFAVSEGAFAEASSEG